MKWGQFEKQMGNREQTRNPCYSKVSLKLTPLSLCNVPNTLKDDKEIFWMPSNKISSWPFFGFFSSNISCNVATSWAPMTRS